MNRVNVLFGLALVVLVGGFVYIFDGMTKQENAMLDSALSRCQLVCSE